MSSADVRPIVQSAVMQAIASRSVKSYSVRSSAALEDSTSHSFAGMFETYLNVPNDEIITHIKMCWLSAFNPNALRYMKQNEMSAANLRMAIIVQEVVHAQKSGVLFQANPRGAINETVIVAGYGLGEGIVGGDVDCDTIYYDRISGHIRKIITKKRERLEYRSPPRFGLEKIPVDAELHPQAVCRPSTWACLPPNRAKACRPSSSGIA